MKKAEEAAQVLRIAAEEAAELAKLDRQIFILKSKSEPAPPDPPAVATIRPTHPMVLELMAAKVPLDGQGQVMTEAFEKYAALFLEFKSVARAIKAKYNGQESLYFSTAKMRIIRHCDLLF